LVIQGWGEQKARFKLDGGEITRGANFLYRHRRTLAGTDLIVWIKISSEKPVRLPLSGIK